ncbi:hypothetical protein Tco_0550979, partial [Tanacetum coccineum]
GGQLNAAPVLGVENFTNWKKRFLCHIIGIEPQFENNISNGPFIPMAARQRKPEGQWTADDRKAANLDQRLKSLIMSVLPDDQMNSVINCLTAKSTWDDLILYHKGPFDVKESRVMDLKLCYNTFKFKEGESLTQTFTRYKALMNELVNDGIKLSNLEINIGFINGLPKKLLSLNTNHVKDSKLASLFGKLKYEENLIDSIYKNEKSKSLVSVTPLSTTFFSTSIVQDFQDSPDDVKDTRSSHEYLNDLEEEYQERALLAKSKRFFKKGTQRSKLLLSSKNKPEPRQIKDFEAKYHKVKAKLALVSSSGSTPSSSSSKNKGLIAETYDEERSSNEDEVTEVKALMALTGEERVLVGKESTRNGDWTKICIKKVHTLLQMEDSDDRKSFLDYLTAFGIKQAKLDLLTMQHVNTKILKENQNLKFELKELTSITETWLNSSNIVNQCINEQNPTQKKKNMGIDQLTKDTSSVVSKEPVFVKSSADNSNMSITNSNIHKSSKTEDSTLPNQDTDKVPSNESQRNTTNLSIVFSDSSATDYDSANESLVCSTPFLPLKKLDGAEPISGPKTIKSILKSKSTFKAETLKGIIINEPSSAPARGKSSSAFKTNSAPTGKLKNVKNKDDPLLAICKRTDHRTCDHAEFMFSMNTNQHHNGQGGSSSRSRPSRTSVYFPSCIHVTIKSLLEVTAAKLKEFDLLKWDPTRGILQLGQQYTVDIMIIIPMIVYTIPLVKYVEAIYDHNTYGHNMIISLKRGINPRNPQHVTKNCETCGSNVHTTSDHNDIEWFKKRETSQAKDVESFKTNKIESSSALRSKTPTKKWVSRQN